MQVADLWLNGKSIGHHEGGYMSFMVDITSSVTLGGSDNVLAIKTDSRSNANGRRAGKTRISNITAGFTAMLLYI